MEFKEKMYWRFEEQFYETDFPLHTLLCLSFLDDSETIYTWNTPPWFNNVRKGKMPKEHYWEKNVKKIDFSHLKKHLEPNWFFSLFIYFTFQYQPILLPVPPHIAPSNIPHLPFSSEKGEAPLFPSPRYHHVLEHQATAGLCGPVRGMGSTNRQQIQGL